MAVQRDSVTNNCWLCSLYNYVFPVLDIVTHFMINCDFIDLKKKKTFKSTNICVIHETIQIGLQNDLFFSIHHYTNHFLNKVPSDKLGEA